MYFLKRSRNASLASPSNQEYSPPPQLDDQLDLQLDPPPALVHAIVVVETEVDAQGSVTDVHVLRAPSHAPDVTQAVLDMIHQASPLPVPQFLGKTKFTEVWLVDHSGSFQLHALTEGQH